MVIHIQSQVQEWQHLKAEEHNKLSKLKLLLNLKDRQFLWRQIWQHQKCQTCLFRQNKHQQEGLITTIIKTITTTPLRLITCLLITKVDLILLATIATIQKEIVQLLQVICTPVIVTRFLMMIIQDLFVKLSPIKNIGDSILKLNTLVLANQNCF